MDTGKMTTVLDELISAVLRDVLIETSPPPQIVPIPEPDFTHSTITIVVPESTMKVLTALASMHGTNQSAVARSILNVISSRVYKASAGHD